MHLRPMSRKYLKLKSNQVGLLLCSSSQELAFCKSSVHSCWASVTPQMEKFCRLDYTYIRPTSYKLLGCREHLFLISVPPPPTVANTWLTLHKYLLNKQMNEW